MNNLKFYRSGYTVAGLILCTVPERGGNCPFFKGITLAPRTSLEVEPCLNSMAEVQQRSGLVPTKI